MGSLSAITETVKLVVWDLDDTLWTGTLSEGEVELPGDHGELVRELNRRGIVSSISSKNDFEQAKARLEDEGLWDEFVFPKINWNPKGQQIADLIGEMQLRPDNVLFIDDNPVNLREARHYSPELMVMLPGDLGELLAHPKLTGKPDPELKRLQQYRVLEAKSRDRAEATDAGNDEFLASCDIHIYLGDDCAAQAERLIDLANRSNQLNFTKRRYAPGEFEAMLAEPGRTTRYVRVYDKYGDYGIVGYYSLLGDTLTDLVFSCRTMNMGIEQWVHSHAGRPAFEVVGEVASELTSPEVSWITLDDEWREPEAAPAPAVATPSAGLTLLKGGCDLSALADLLAGVEIQSEFNYINDRGQLVQGHHSETVKQAVPETIDRYGDVIDRLAITDPGAYTTRLRDPSIPYETVIYSLILDYTQNLYRYRDTDFLMPFDQLHIDVTDERNWPRVLDVHGGNALSAADLRWFAENFTARGPLTPDEFAANVKWLAGLRPSTKFIFLNAPEVPVKNDLEPDRHLRHHELNEALDQAMTEIPNAELCDLREIVRSKSDTTLNIRHFNRVTYARMAETVGPMLGSDATIVAPSVREQARLVLRDVRFRAKALAHRGVLARR
ncbi:MAG TPA: HAD-IIIC family phosphatase [Solirubrobacteraceae bacterium]|nr:HAD-IIIC family phosphatase [Solirubrobacteraceae bacterium]